MYILKAGQPAIEIMDGPQIGQKFVPGEQYLVIPEAEKKKFRKVAPPKTAAKAAKEEKE